MELFIILEKLKVLIKQKIVYYWYSIKIKFNTKDIGSSVCCDGVCLTLVK